MVNFTGVAEIKEVDRKRRVPIPTSIADEINKKPSTAGARLIKAVPAQDGLRCYLPDDFRVHTREYWGSVFPEGTLPNRSLFSQVMNLRITSDNRMVLPGELYGPLVTVRVVPMGPYFRVSYPTE